MGNLLVLTESINTKSPLGIFLSFLYLFIIGSFLGWILEIFFRRIVSQKKWTNPGFLKGPCLPLYGFGLCLLYLICLLCFEFLCNGEGIPTYYNVLGEIKTTGSLNFWYTSIIAVILIGIGMTLLEFLAGLIFIKGFRIKLWDYSKLKGNIMGIICPIFSFLWLVAGAAYWFFVQPYVLVALEFFTKHIWGLTFFLGAYAGVLVVDIVNSVKLAARVSNIAKQNKLIVDFAKFQNNIVSNKGKLKSGNKSWVEQQVLLAASKIKSKVGELTYDIKRHMYVGNEIPAINVAESDETPRTKAKNKDVKKDE